MTEISIISMFLFNLKGTTVLLQTQTYLSEGDDEAANGLLFTGEADVVGGDEHLAQDVHLVERSPQRAVCVSIQLLVFRQAEQRAVSFTFSPGVQIPEMKWENFYIFKGSSFTISPRRNSQR